VRWATPKKCPNWRLSKAQPSTSPILGSKFQNPISARDQRRLKYRKEGYSHANAWRMANHAA